MSDDPTIPRVLLACLERVALGLVAVGLVMGVLGLAGGFGALAYAACGGFGL